MNRWICLAAVACACGPTPVATDGGAAGGGTGSVGGGTGSVGGGSSPLSRSGEILIAQLEVAAGGMTFQGGFVLAEFLEQSLTNASCTKTIIGPCTLSDCRAADAGTPGGQVSAGMLTLTGLQGGPVAIQPRSGTHYSYDAPLGPPFFRTGDPISLSASGATVPPFSISMTAPDRARLTSPTCVEIDCGNLSRDAGLSLAWTGGSHTVSTEFVAGPIQLVCSFPAAAGTTTIPSQALSSFPAGTLMLRFSTEDRQTTQAGPFPLSAALQQTALYQFTVTP